MSETIFKATGEKVFVKSFLSLIPFYIQISFNIIFLVINNVSVSQLIYINILWGFLLSFPGLWIFLNYWNNARNTKLVLKNDSITLISKDETTELINSEIIKIEIYQIKPHSKFPWAFYNYSKFYTKNKSIAFNHFTAEIEGIWQNSLSKKISVDRIDHIYSWYPLMRISK